MPNLRELEEGFFRALTRPHGMPLDPTLAGWVESRAPLDGAARIDVYAHMYCGRIIEALMEDYPGVVATIGAAAFDTVAHRYLAAHPSTQPSLRHAGARLAEFLATGPLPDLPAFAPDLARLEWARLAVFDAADAPLLTMAALQRMPLERWAEMRLTPVPAVRTLALAWPVHELGGADGPDPATAILRPGTVTLRVWRKQFGVYAAAMDEIERTAFAVLEEGGSFGALCAALAAIGEDAAAGEAAGLVVRWIEDEILAGAV
jgi:hypothetical protein